MSETQALIEEARRACIGLDRDWAPVVAIGRLAEALKAEKARADKAEAAHEAADVDETVYRINEQVYAGTTCASCGSSYWRCTDRVLNGDSLGCCDACRDESGHRVRTLPQVTGLIAEERAAHDALRQQIKALAVILDRYQRGSSYDGLGSALIEALDGVGAVRLLAQDNQQRVEDNTDVH